LPAGQSCGGFLIATYWAVSTEPTCAIRRGTGADPAAYGVPGWRFFKVGLFAAAGVVAVAPPPGVSGWGPLWEKDSMVWQHHQPNDRPWRREQYPADMTAVALPILDNDDKAAQMGPVVNVDQHRSPPGQSKPAPSNCSKFARLIRLHPVAGTKKVQFAAQSWPRRGSDQTGRWRRIIPLLVLGN